MNAIVLPADLPNAARARLPQLYEGAKNALVQCERIDECKDWADKMEAMASYAKQAKDDSLRVACDRIQARAIRRCGELLKQIPKQGGPGRPPKKDWDAPPRLSLPSPRDQAARGAGLSRDQAKTALRVANVPEDAFEEAVESASPPTVTELAERGKRPAPKSPVDLRGRTPEDFKIATRALGEIGRVAVFCVAADPSAIARGCTSKERRTLLIHAQAIAFWLKRLCKEIE